MGAELPKAPDLVALARNASDARALRRRSLLNLSRMGHCAPTVMQTVLDLVGAQSERLVRLSAGLPGGIGNTGAECGGVTAPMLLLGLQADLPDLLPRAHAYLRHFADNQRSLLCRDIRGDARLPLVCIGVIQRSVQLLAAPEVDAMEEGRATCHRILLEHLERAHFHCAHEVLRELAAPAEPDPWLCRAASLFVGGLAFAGLTCSALTAGVLVLGDQLATIEESRARVLHMIGLMVAGADAFADEVNEFNKSMNRGQRLARWFEAEFGSTQCRTITGCNFGVPADVERFVRERGFEPCRALARRVGAQVRLQLADARATP